MDGEAPAAKRRRKEPLRIVWGGFVLEGAEALEMYRHCLPARYEAYRARAERKGLPFEITFELFEYLSRRWCIYCAQWPPEPFCGIDRVDNARGYVIGNVVACCKTCNSRKSRRTLEDWLRSCVGLPPAPPPFRPRLGREWRQVSVNI